MIRDRHPEGTDLVLSLPPEVFKGLLALRDAEHRKGNAISLEAIAFEILRSALPVKPNPSRPRK